MSAAALKRALDDRCWRRHPSRFGRLHLSKQGATLVLTCVYFLVLTCVYCSFGEGSWVVKLHRFCHDPIFQWPLKTVTIVFLIVELFDNKYEAKTEIDVVCGIVLTLDAFQKISFRYLTKMSGANSLLLHGAVFVSYWIFYLASGATRSFSGIIKPLMVRVPPYWVSPLRRCSTFTDLFKKSCFACHLQIMCSFTWFVGGKQSTFDAHINQDFSQGCVQGKICLLFSVYPFSPSSHLDVAAFPWKVRIECRDGNKCQRFSEQFCGNVCGKNCSNSTASTARHGLVVLHWSNSWGVMFVLQYITSGENWDQIGLCLRCWWQHELLIGCLYDSVSHVFVQQVELRVFHLFCDGWYFVRVINGDDCNLHRIAIWGIYCARWLRPLNSATAKRKTGCCR